MMTDGRRRKQELHYGTGETLTRGRTDNSAAGFQSRLLFYCVTRTVFPISLILFAEIRTLPHETLNSDLRP